MLVYVINKHDEPLMPCSPAKARLMLKNGKAKIVKIEPFTIQLLYGSSGYVQPISLGVDAGSKYVGLSATTSKKEVFAGEIKLRTDIVDLLSLRKSLRSDRRKRKTRYRKCRFINRGNKKKGWLAPSVKNKINCHLEIIYRLHEFLPINKIVVETASFDIQKIKNPNISGKDYQHGEQLGFWNVREYVLFRDGHKCQCCKGRRKDDILNVHHIQSRKIGGNAPNNLITLCKTCHREYHAGLIKLPNNIKRGMSFRDATFMGIMRWKFYNIIKRYYPNVKMTFGYITKNTRVKYNLPKEHCIDARCISGNPTVEHLGVYYYYQKVRCHNRQIHKVKIYKYGVRRNNQAQYEVKGFRIFDRVKYQGKLYYIFGRRNSGYFNIRNLYGEVVNGGNVNCNKLKLITCRKSWLIERRHL